METTACETDVGEITVGETTVGDTTTDELSNRGEESTDSSDSTNDTESGVTNTSSQGLQECASLSEKREIIFRSIIDKLRVQNLEAEQAVAVAQARVQEVEADALAQQATAAKPRMEAQTFREKSDCAESGISLKQAKELDQHRAKKHQRRAIAERRMHELKQTVLDEARQQAAQDCKSIREHAMREMASLKAQARAEVNTMKSKARAAAKTKVRDSAFMLGARAEATEAAESQATKPQAEIDVEPDSVAVPITADEPTTSEVGSNLSEQTVARAEATEAAESQATKPQAEIDVEPDSVAVPITADEPTTSEVGSNLSDETVALEEDWEMLTSSSVEQHVDSPWDIVVV